MKFTRVLWKQHLGRMFKKNWFAHGKLNLGDTLSETALARKGIKVVDPDELVKLPKPYKLRPIVITPKPQPISKEQRELMSRPDWNEIPCMKHEDSDLLVQGTDQAQQFTKTLLVKNALPDHIEALVSNTNSELDDILQRRISTSTIFDACQETLPIRKDPSRPAWVFPRDYGLTDVRKSTNLCQNIIQLCESICGPIVAQQRQLIYNGIVRVPLEKDKNLVMLNLTMDMMVMSTKSLSCVESLENTSELTLPSIYPLLSTISMLKDHLYIPTDLFPVSENSAWRNPHTLFVYHDQVKVKNITELPVTQNQLLARSLMKSFVAAAGSARQRFGNNVTDLPEPIVVQCVQSDSKAFHFSVFQLNTLDVNGTEGKCNLWWSMPQVNLYEKATYENGRPVLEGYNPEVFKRILAFYRNV